MSGDGPESYPGPEGVGSIPPEDGDPSVGLTRRDALKGLVFAGGILAAAAATLPGVRKFTQDALLGTSSEGAHAEGEPNGEKAKKHGVSRINVLTALPVVGEFFNAVLKNMRKGEKHEDFGLNSFKRVGVAESIRLGVLRVTDREQYEHESKDIAISYGLMSVLTTVAEATEHLDADEESMFNDKINKIVDKMDNDPSVMSEMPGLDGSLEDWQRFETFKEDAIVRVDAQNTALGTLGAVSPFISSTLGDAMNMRMSVQLTELAHAKEIIKLKQGSNGPITADQEMQAMKSAVSVSNEQVNGRLGYVNKTLTLSANLQAAGAFGDAPVWFYLLRNGPSEWIKASAEGLVKANATALVASQVWLAKTVGFDKSKSALHETFSSTVDVWQGTSDFVGLKDQSRQRNEKVAEQFGDAIATARDAGELSYMELRGLRNVHNQLMGSMSDMSRSRFVYRKEDFYRVMGEAVDNNRLKLRNIGRFLTGREIISDVREIAFYVDVENVGEVSEALGKAKNPSELFDAILDDHVGLKNSNIVGGMKDMLTVLVKLKQADGDMNSLSDEERAILDEDTLKEFGLNFDENSEGFIRGDEQLEARIDEVRELYLAGNESAYQKLEELLGDTLKTSPENLKAAIRETWASIVKADTVADEDNHHTGFGHASTEVFNALRTQILAANALSSLIKKGLEELGDTASIGQKTALVLVFSGFISAVADNVVAYLFAEDVLSNLYKEELGEAAFSSEDAEHLVTRIKRAALFVAIIFGSMSKIGNGPNFKQHKVVASVGEDGFEYEKEELDLTSSFQNGVAWSISAAGLADNVHSVNKAMDGFKEAA